MPMGPCKICSLNDPPVSREWMKKKKNREQDFMSFSYIGFDYRNTKYILSFFRYWYFVLYIAKRDDNIAKRLQIGRYTLKEINNVLIFLYI